MLAQYLPKRYRVASAHVVDSIGNFSDQIDAVVFDRQYSPFIFTYANQLIVPTESVYAVFEAKQTADANLVKYAQDKVASVRSLHRTSLPIPHAGGVETGNGFLVCTDLTPPVQRHCANDRYRCLRRLADQIIAAKFHQRVLRHSEANRCWVAASGLFC